MIRVIFTTQADATHFSGCKGKITSCNGLYEGMMDDAINVHGTYLKVVKRIDDHTLVGRYMHDQSWGFEWGRAGDEVQFVQSSPMELIGNQNKIASIRPHDKEQAIHGCDFKWKRGIGNHSRASDRGRSDLSTSAGVNGKTDNTPCGYAAKSARQFSVGREYLLRAL